MMCLILFVEACLVLLEFNRFASKLTNAEVIQHRVRLFDEEQKRQVFLSSLTRTDYCCRSHTLADVLFGAILKLSKIKRIEKIQVKHVGQPEMCTLIMNKGISTPYNCAMRKSKPNGFPVCDSLVS
jgi:hypothetical protein